MAIYDRKGAAARVHRDVSTIYRWERQGLLTFVLDRVREDDLLRADREARSRRGRPRQKSAISATNV